MAQESGDAGRGGGTVTADRIDELRKRIDALDEALVRLLNERATCALEIGHLHRDVAELGHGLPLRTGTDPRPQVLDRGVLCQARITREHQCSRYS